MRASVHTQETIPDSNHSKPKTSPEQRPVCHLRYLDNMTSERVDAEGVKNVAAAAKDHIKAKVSTLACTFIPPISNHCLNSCGRGTSSTASPASMPGAMSD